MYNPLDASIVPVIRSPKKYDYAQSRRASDVITPINDDNHTRNRAPTRTYDNVMDRPPSLLNIEKPRMNQGSS